jgi:F-type H+-transporting ATPase subunit d
VFKGSPEVAAAVSSFRAWAAGAEAMAEKYSAPPSPVDFAKSKSAIRDKAIVDELEKFYSSNTPPPEVFSWSEKDKADKMRQIEEAKERMAFTAEMIEDTEREISFMNCNRTTRMTSGSDIKEAYPDIADEVEKELEQRKWFKDAIN